MSRSSTQSGPNFPDAMVGSGIGFVIVGVACWFLMYGVFKLIAPHAVLDWRSGAAVSGQYGLSLVDLSLPERRLGTWPGIPNWRHLEAHLRRNPTTLRAIKVSTWAGVVGGSMAAGLMFALLVQPRPRETRRSGSRLTRSGRGFSKDQEDDPERIYLHPDVQMSQERQSRHLMIIGGTGTGKSQVLGHLMQSVSATSDAAVVYDFKGDLTAKYLCKEAALIAPWDSRGWALAIGRDIDTHEHARTLAEALIPDTASDPVWSNAARAILTAAFRWCVDNKPGSWTLADALGQLTKGDDEIRDLVERYVPYGLTMVADPHSRTTQSIRITLSSYLAPIEALARAWEGVPENRTLSIRNWLKSGSPRIVILQGNAELKPLSTALHRTFFRVLQAAVGSPSFPESRTRRRWFFGDEFLQFGKVDQLVELLQTARSKGVRFVLAAQDVPSIRAIYGADAGNAVLGAAGTTIITGSNCPITREWVSKLVGNEIVERLEISRSYGRDNRSETERWAEVSRPIFSPDDVGSKLGQIKKGRSAVTRALVIGARATVALLDWPRLQLPEVAESHVSADWLTSPRRSGTPPAGAMDRSHPCLDKAPRSPAQVDPHHHETPDAPRHRLIIRNRDK